MSEGILQVENLGSEEQYRVLFERMMNGFVLHKVVVNEAGVPIDYEFLELNKAYEEMTGLKRENLIGKKVTEAIPGIDKDKTNWIQMYGEIALTGKELRLESYSEAMKRWYSIYGFSPKKMYFALLIEEVTERKKLEENIKRDVTLFNLQQKLGGLAYLEIEPSGEHTINAEKGIKDLLGLEESDPVSYEAIRNKIPASEQATLDEIVKTTVNLGQAGFEFRVNYKDGRDRWISGAANLLHDDEKSRDFVFMVMKDNTKVKETEAHLKKMIRLYTMLTNVNQTIIRAKDKAEMFQKVCETIRVDGNYKMAWVGLVGEDGQTVVPIANSGGSDEYIKGLNIVLNDEARGNGPTGMAIKTGEAVVVDDFVNDPKMLPWREMAIREGFKASASFPIKVHDKVIGALSVYAKEMDFVDDDEVKLLKELCGDVSFALEFREHNLEKEMALKKLEESEMRWQYAIEGTGQGLWDWDIKAGKVFFSKQWKAMLGFDEGDISDDISEWKKRIHPEDLKMAEQEVNSYLTGVSPVYSCEHRVQCKDGSWKWILDRGKIFEWDDTGKPARMIGTHTDISTIREHEEKLKVMNDSLKDKISELERMQKIMVDREIKMIELKRKISEFESEHPEALSSAS